MSQDAIIPILPRPLPAPDGKRPPLRTDKVVKKGKITGTNDIQVRPKSSHEHAQQKHKKPDPDEEHNIDLFV
ncbi:hypothetical protein ACVFI8_20060 [Agarivorans sp. MS3-6]|uniref:hypothetical protein n=1 Tax=Agarivorans sp. TSD2052 TaxID=2937286 RepID=UPI00200D9532|nr:hypothetical protein [Agarivorans sp. TSD2052]UPW16872.1 hypothetical protein M0C34_11495 [Agarivorans sp. TSD2052]